MNARKISIVSPAESTRVIPPPEDQTTMPLAEDLARREKTPFVMTSTGRYARGALGWETGERTDRGLDQFRV